MGDDKRQNAFCTGTHETLKQANPLLVNGLLEKQERKWVSKAVSALTESTLCHCTSKTSRPILHRRHAEAAESK